MTDEIYIIDPASRSASAFSPVRFSDIGIRERGDLQEWVLANPEILGEDLLVVTSEFAGFDRSNRRLDVLALDPDANLVIIELKLELKQSFADLQALRYAAFCSTMTMDQVIEELAKYTKVSVQSAATTIAEFLGAEEDELPEPSDRPRMILVAGSMDEPEVISTVLWLRNFDLDIRCLEVTPYKTSGNQLIIVPRPIVPLPEAEEYQVRIERKESSRAKKTKGPSPYARLWEGITREFNALDTLFPITRKPARSYLQIAVGEREWHYEWVVKVRASELHVAIHFESSSRERNLEKLELVKAVEADVSQGIDEPFVVSAWGKRWAYGAFVMPLEPVLADPDSHCARAAALMDQLIRRTYPNVTGSS